MSEQSTNLKQPQTHTDDSSESTQSIARILTTFSRCSEFDSSLERDHARRTVAAESDAQQSGWGRNGAGERAKARLGSWFSRSAGLVAGQSEVGMIEDIEDLRVKTEGQMLCNRNLFRHVNLGIREMRSAVVIAAGVSELTKGW